jgi:outer membrane protein OmpA-like peptidoglycan-associated protein
LAASSFLRSLAPAAVILCLAANSAPAQQTVDQTPPGKRIAAPAHVSMPSGSAAAAHAHPKAPPSVRPPGPPKPPTVPLAPPPVPVLPPPIAVPVRPAPPPPPPPISPDAPGTVGHSTDGLRVTFGADRTDLNPDSSAAIAALTHAPAAGPDTTYTVFAYAAGAPDDPSTPRRLSLSRALAVRSVLMAQGVASVRIYVKALGAASPTFADGPPDRVDVTVGTVTPATPSGGAPQPGQPPPASPAPASPAPASPAPASPASQKAAP